MWNPFRSEGDAFRFAIATAAAAALSLALGLYVSAALGWAVFAVAAVAGLTLAARRKPERAQHLKEAAVRRTRAALRPTASSSSRTSRSLGRCSGGRSCAGSSSGPSFTWFFAKVIFQHYTNREQGRSVARTSR